MITVWAVWLHAVGTAILHEVLQFCFVFREKQEYPLTIMQKTRRIALIKNKAKSHDEDSIRISKIQRAGVGVRPVLVGLQEKITSELHGPKQRCASRVRK